MSLEVFYLAVLGPLSFVLAGTVVFFVTGWSDKRDRLRGS